ncbi:MAG: prepilin-type N-terminal cleavage/methylation domain-containing protein [Thermodesulfobacteriota bacterium]|nr:prepilin-type N-terminal cleavage/methylation domain-containing protein [Thermodesulfobacteriota bacterium]
MRKQKKTLFICLTSCRCGFTIMEILVAMAIFAIGILGVAKMQIIATMGNTSSRTVTEAVFFAQSRLETLLALPYDHNYLEDGDGDGDGLAGLDDEKTDTTEADHYENIQGIYTVSWNIAEDEPVEDAKRIRTIVSWQTTASGSQTRVLNAIKYLT